MRWIADAETQSAIHDFELKSDLDQLNYLENRIIDLYYSLAGELFDYLRTEVAEPADWSALGRALVSVSRALENEARADALFFAAVAFYQGGYPASAVMVMKATEAEHWESGIHQAAYELLTRSSTPQSEAIRTLVEAVRSGNRELISVAVSTAEQETKLALNVGPDEWVAHRLYTALLQRFQHTNLRTVLPDGMSANWTPLIESFLGREQPVWDFFPSQIEAIQAGLLTEQRSFSLQMPTGAGKTALTETLLYSHLSYFPGSKAVLLVPYRALARELRGTVGRHLNDMGIRTRTIYGGTIPSMEESENVDSVRTIIATPEALTGLLSSNPELLPAISLVVCDEGHLLDNGARGIGLELLLARLRARTPDPRIIFLSAIVPNVEEINTWLGGTNATVVRSEYRPALAEYAVLRPNGKGQNLTTGLELHEPTTLVPAHTLPKFLQVDDFRFLNSQTGRQNTYKYDSTKTQAIATARKALVLGPVVVFATEKGGNRGVVGLANELINQIASDLPLPAPLDYTGGRDLIDDAIDYLIREYGEDWVGTRLLQLGAIIHHGDLPQQTREVLEELVAGKHIAMIMCTSTLAEGVNLPIRTMVLYSVKRSSHGGAPEAMLARDLKNLVGRAGRPGSSTRGLVICANPNDWETVEPVAEGRPGESVEGALIDLIRRLKAALTVNQVQLDNDVLEQTSEVFSLVDGVDAALIELISDELGIEEFARIAESVAFRTFAAAKADESEQDLLIEVFHLRARRLIGIRSEGRLSWLQETSAKPRLVNTVIDDLFSRYSAWQELESPNDPELISAFTRWAFEQPGFRQEAETAYRGTSISDLEGSLSDLVLGWIQGQTLKDIALNVNIEIDILLRIHAKLILFDLTTLVEQAVALIQQYLMEMDLSLSSVISKFPDYLRFGVPTEPARELMANGLRHRRAAVELGAHEAMATTTDIHTSPWSVARNLLTEPYAWVPRLGSLIYRQSVIDTLGK